MKKANSLTRNLVALSLCMIAIVPMACAASDDDDVAAFQNFTLTDGFMAKYQAAEADISKDPCGLSPMKVMAQANASSSKMTLSQAAAQYDAQPGVHAMLASHDLTAKEMFLGMSTLMAAAAQDLNQAHPGMVKATGAASQVSAANIAFYQSHKQALHQFNMQLAKQQMQASGGKLPSCLSGGGMH
jgi:hypothetical protein